MFHTENLQAVSSLCKFIRSMRTQEKDLDVSCFISISCWAIDIRGENGVGGKNPELHKTVFPLLF